MTIEKGDANMKRFHTRVFVLLLALVLAIMPNV